MVSASEARVEAAAVAQQAQATAQQRLLEDGLTVQWERDQLQVDKDACATALAARAAAVDKARVDDAAWEEAARRLYSEVRMCTAQLAESQHLRTSLEVELVSRQVR